MTAHRPERVKMATVEVTREVEGEVEIKRRVTEAGRNARWNVGRTPGQVRRWQVASKERSSTGTERQPGRIKRLLRGGVVVSTQAERRETR